MLISFDDIKIRLFTIFSLNDIPIIFFLHVHHIYLNSILKITVALQVSYQNPKW